MLALFSHSFWADFFTLEGYTLRMLAAFILCLALGVERQSRQKDAGIKTHVLVGMGSCIFTLVSAHGFGAIPGLAGGPDPARIAAQIVSGIGFLGAGVIFVNNDTVRGLTTAATIWLSAAMGMACGASLIPIAFVALLLHYFLVFLIAPLSNYIPTKNRSDVTRIEFIDDDAPVRKIQALASTLGYRATLLSVSTIVKGDEERCEAIFDFDGLQPDNQLLELLAELENVKKVSRFEGTALD